MSFPCGKITYTRAKTVDSQKKSTKRPSFHIPWVTKVSLSVKALPQTSQTKGFFPCMRPNMSHQCMLLSKAPWALRTFMGFDSTVTQCMQLHVILSWKESLAYRTGKTLFVYFFIINFILFLFIFKRFVSMYEICV